MGMVSSNNRTLDNLDKECTTSASIRTNFWASLINFNWLKKNIIKDRGSTAQYIVYTFFFTVYAIFTDYIIYNVLLLFVVACVPKYCSGRFRTLLETAVELLSKMWGNGLDGWILWYTVMTTGALWRDQMFQVSRMNSFHWCRFLLVQRVLDKHKK